MNQTWPPTTDLALKAHHMKSMCSRAIIQESICQRGELMKEEENEAYTKMYEQKEGERDFRSFQLKISNSLVG